MVLTEPTTAGALATIRIRYEPAGVEAGTVALMVRPVDVVPITEGLAGKVPFGPDNWAEKTLVVLNVPVVVKFTVTEAAVPAQVALGENGLVVIV